MSILRSDDREVLASGVANSLVLAVDAGAASASVRYWDLARPWTKAVVEAVGKCGDLRIRALGEDLLERPADPVRYAALRSALLADDADPAVTEELFELGWQVECHSQLGFHLGERYRERCDVVTAEDLGALPAGDRPGVGADPEVLVVVPFRGREVAEQRLRNLLACLLALRDQSYGRDRYRVTVVESDAVPRWRHLIARYADHYLFAPKAGPFNKSWAVNAGVVHTPGNPEVFCLLDADMLVDGDFVARNAARFRRPGTGGHLAHRDVVCMDEGVTSWAVRQRLLRGAGALDLGDLRGFVTRRSPGYSVWTRMRVFHEICGMDERYEGWGGEDNDLVYRLDMATALDVYDDVMLHMNHPPSSELITDDDLDEKRCNPYVGRLDWRPDEPIGRLDRFTDPA